MVSQAYLNLKRYADAEKDATVVLQADPGNMKASYRRGRARLNLPRPDKEGGCRDLARVVSNNPKNHEVSRSAYCESVKNGAHGLASINSSFRIVYMLGTYQVLY